MARGTESPGAAGEHDEPLLATIRTSYAGKAALWIAAVQIALHDVFGDRPEKQTTSQDLNTKTTKQ